MIGLADIERARARIASILETTPCRMSPAFSEQLGMRAFFKYETLQLTGSFKVRGAYNKISSLSRSEAERGVITASAGNHAQGVAFSACQAGVPSTIVMPRTTPLIKIENTRRLGGRVVLAGEVFDEACEEARRLEAEKGLVFVHPFDDEQVIAGQGTIGLEILEQVPEVEVIVVPVGGGGLISGIVAAVKAKKPSVRIYGVQTEAAPAMAESFRAGRAVTCQASRSVADGIAVKGPGDLTFEYIRRYVDDVVTVSEDAIRAAVIRLLETGKTVVEGAAAAAFAAVAGRQIPELAQRSVVMVLSGANIDLALLARIIDRSLVESHRLVRFRTRVPDRPGGLAELLQVIAQHGGNVLRIQHDRVFMYAGFWQAQIDVTLETRNEEHIEELHQALLTEGYEVEWPNLFAGPPAA
ncbi:MAG TPA: threonine ammonia-lyase [Thermoanaerobaculia bacterium]|nr:threonine ammonia-lyase [Thermoanaerobaculia bacterium]